MNLVQTKHFISLFFLSLLMVANSIQAQEGGDKLVVHIRSAAVTLNHVALKNEGLAQEVAASLEKVEGVTRTRALPISGMVEAGFDTQKTTGEQVSSAAKKILEEKLAGRKIEAQDLPSHKAGSKILVKSLGDNRVQLTSERFY
jgi:hypothetical protein